jgi:hypothetical protein
MTSFLRWLGAVCAPTPVAGATVLAVVAKFVVAPAHQVLTEVRPQDDEKATICLF